MDGDLRWGTVLCAVPLLFVKAREQKHAPGAGCASRGGGRRVDHASHSLFRKSPKASSDRVAEFRIPPVFFGWNSSLKSPPRPDYVLPPPTPPQILCSWNSAVSGGMPFLVCPRACVSVSREGAWDKAARDPNDEMVQAGLTPDNIRKWEYLKGIQGQNETVCARVWALSVAAAD